MRNLIEADLARAEAVIHDSKTRSLHPPTLDNFKGQALALRRVLGMLEMEERHPRSTLQIHRTYSLTIPWPMLITVVAFIVGLVVLT